MTDLERVELAARRAADKIGGPAQYAFIAFAAEIKELIKSKEESER